MRAERYVASHSFLAEVDGGAAFVAVSPLSGSVDLLSPREAAEWRRLLGDSRGLDPGIVRDLERRGHVYAGRRAERVVLAGKYREFRRDLASSPIQIHIVPTYGCNLRCTYCFQQDTGERPEVISPDVVEALFAHLRRQFSGEWDRLYVTLFGGEPLMPNARQMSAIEHIIAKCRAGGLPLAVVTNGVSLVEYLPLLRAAAVQEIQVTVDGPPEVHDRRRPGKDGRGTFLRIMAGVAGAVAAHLPVNFRVVLDWDNLPYLPELARLLEAEGWLDLGADRFKPQLGRNYNLFAETQKTSSLLSRSEFLAALSELSARHPEVRRLYRPDFKGLGPALRDATPLEPVFDACPACKREWVFDLCGRIYGCSATCGRPELAVGAYYPEASFTPGRLRPWQVRSVLSIPECRDCRLSLVCGGGCGALALGRHGRVLAPDCRPVEALARAAVEYYGPRLAEVNWECEST
jgi:uncharacterized protein